MSVADLIRQMSALGAPAEAIALAVEAIENAHADVERGRAAARDRKRRQRERARDSHGDVTGQSQDNTGHEPSPAPLPNKAPQTPKINPTPHPHPGCSSAHTREADPISSAADWIMPLRAAMAAIVAGGAVLDGKRWRGMPPPPGVSAEQWAGFLDYRKAKREALTPRAYQLFGRMLIRLEEDGWPPGEVVDVIVERGWLTAKPEWMQRLKPSGTSNGNRPDNHRRHGDHDLSPMARAIAEREAGRAGEPD